MKRLYTPLMFLFLLLTHPLSVLAAPPPEPSKDPVLRIETDQHNAPINQIAADGAGRFLATASDDKTIRIWDASSGRLLRIIRPPVGGGNEGKLYAIALSPDGSLVAAGGWTNLGSEKGHTVYIFNRASGNMLRRFSSEAGTIHDLAFSPDGQLLAAALFGKNGFRIFRTSDGKVMFHDKEFGDGYNYLSFDQSGRLVVANAGGAVRLYGRSFEKLAAISVPDGKIPRRPSFSPDGSRIALGYSNSTRIDLFSGRDLDLLFSPNATGGPAKGSLGSVAWSQDGYYLYAAGGATMPGIGGLSQRFIRRWDNRGAGMFSDTPVADNTISSLLSLNNGQIVFSAADPAFGVLDRNGSFRAHVLPQTFDLRDMNTGFKVSPDGQTLSFLSPFAGISPHLFNTLERRLQAAPPPSSLVAPLTKHDRLSITDWKNNVAPKLNGKPLGLKNGEIARAVSILPDGSGFVLGADWTLRLYDADGSTRWQMAVPGTNWAVNVAWQSRLAVAAYSDGTIRWQRLSDGKTICSFFPHRDRKRWVIWTPGGYYDASPGGEELIGWHVNNGKDQAADFFPSSKFRSSRYRPDVIAKVFETLDVKEAVKLADAERGITTPVRETDIAATLPPVVNITSPADSSTVSTSTITLRYTVRTPSNEPVTNLRVLVDGRPIAANRGLQAVAKSNAEQTVQVTIPERNCEISIIAENRFSASEPATIRLTWAGKAPQQDEFVIKPKLYVLAVGISSYQLPDLKLQFAAKDARDFAAAVQAQKGGMYRDVTVRLLPDATKDDVLDGLEWLQKEVTSRDVAMVFLAGHGVNDSAGTYYFLPVNVDPDKLKRTGVPFSDIKNTLSALAGKAVLFVDTCHSGNVMGGGRRAITDVNAVINELSSAENGVVVFASSTGRQYSLEDAKWGNGAFTKALVEGLRGKADLMSKGKITVNTLDAWLAERVKELTGGKQTPTTTKPTTVPDFPLAMR